MSAAPAPEVLVIGLGNPDRRDDAVGLVVARLLRDVVPPGVHVFECHGDPLALLDRWRDAGLAIVVDAMAAGMAAGTVERLEMCDGRLPGSLQTLSTHGMGLRDAVDLARELGGLPGRLVVYAVEGKDFGFGEGVSLEVEGSLGTLQEQVLKEAGCTRSAWPATW